MTPEEIKALDEAWEKHKDNNEPVGQASLYYKDNGEYFKYGFDFARAFYLERGVGEFKNFHENLCKRFGYGHDEVDWKRDQASLIEHIATQISALKSEKESLKSRWIQADEVYRRENIEKQFAEKDAEIERLNKIIADQDETFQVWIKHREQDKSEIKKLRLALKYAADKENWSEPDPGCPYWILWDDGNPITWDYFEKVLSAGGGK
jgi:hypothetical protein